VPQIVPTVGRERWALSAGRGCRCTARPATPSASGVGPRTGLAAFWFPGANAKPRLLLSANPPESAVTVFDPDGRPRGVFAAGFRGSSTTFLNEVGKSVGPPE
jgi:hypothetical protein